MCVQTSYEMIKPVGIYTGSVITDVLIPETNIPLYVDENAALYCGREVGRDIWVITRLDLFRHDWTEHAGRVQSGSR